MGMYFKVCCILSILVGGCVVSFGFPQPEAKDTQSNITETMAYAEPIISESVSSPVSQTPQYDDSDMYLEPDGEADQVSHSTHTEKAFIPSELEGGSQTFYPSFLYNNQPLGHSRPIFYQQEAAYSQRPNGAYHQQQLNYDNNLKYNNPFRRENYQVAAATDASQGLLGSGNFGVIRGGTFYNENDKDQLEQYNIARYNTYNPFYHNNGHGRPTYFFGATNPRPQQHEQFANFRDFADINTPNPAYSQFVVVYINKNGSTIETPKKTEPKNIIERLAMLDMEVKKGKDSSPPKKVSESKRKLALVPPEKKGRGKKTTTTTPSTDLYEPLLALS